MVRCFFSLVFLPLLIGCGGSMGQIDGKVVWTDGTPAKELSGGQVIFESQAMRITARGQIGPDGSFTLRTTTVGDGAKLGDYEVAIVEHRPSSLVWRRGQCLDATAVADPVL